MVGVVSAHMEGWPSAGDRDQQISLMSSDTSGLRPRKATTAVWAGDTFVTVDENACSN